MDVTACRSRSARSGTWWCVPQASNVLEMSEREGSDVLEYVKTATTLSSQHVKSRAPEVEKHQSIQQKSLHRKTQYSAEESIPQRE